MKVGDLVIINDMGVGIIAQTWKSGRQFLVVHSGCPEGLVYYDEELEVIS